MNLHRFARLGDAGRFWGDGGRGLTLGADPIANALSVISFQKGRPIKSFIVRKDVKDHGTKNAVEGNVKPGERVAIIDDVITTAVPPLPPSSGPVRRAW